MSSSRTIVLTILSLMAGLGISLNIGHQPASAQSTSRDKTWLSFLRPGEIIDLAVAGDDIWAATKYSVIHWDRASGDYTQYTSVDGIPAGQISDLALDPSGRPWVLTPYHGIGMFDGQHWSTFNPLEAFSLAFVPQEPAAFWIATPYSGISYFEGRPLPEHRATYTSTTGLPSEALTLLALDPAGRPWLGTASGVGHFDGQHWLIYSVEAGLPAAPVATIAFDPEGRPWAGTSGGGLSWLDPTQPEGQWTTYTVEDGLASNWITTIAFDGAGQPWVGTATGGVSYLPAGASRWMTYTVAEGLADHVVEAITIDAAGQPWVVTRNGGMSWFDGQQWTIYPYPGDTSNRWVTATTLDETGQVWLGQANGQVSQLTWPEQPGADPQWVTYGTTGPADNQITAAAVDSSGYHWFGTRTAGILLFDGQTWRSYTSKEGLPSNSITALVGGEAGSLWVGTRAGASYFDGQSWTHHRFSSDPYHNQVQALALDPAGHPWVGTPSGLHRFDGQSWRSYTTEDGLTGDNIQAIAVEESGEVWAGTFQGASRLVLDETAGSLDWTTYTAEDGLADDAIRAIAIDTQGNKWFGTSSGLSKFDGQSWTTYTTADGLGNDAVSFLVPGLAGQLWVGSSIGGVTEYDGQNWVVHLPDLYIAAVGIDPAGSAWFGTSFEGIRALAEPSQAETFSFAWEPAIWTPSGLSFSPTEIFNQAPPLVANLSPAGSPLQPLQAWTVAPDGAVFGLDAANTLYQLEPGDLSPLAQSPRLFETGAGDAPYLVADLNLVFVGNKALTETLVLDRADFTEVARLPQAGPMAVDPGQQLIMIPQELVAPAYTWEFWVYDLANLAQAPQQVQTGCSSGPPAIDPLHRRLYLQNRICEASPPHQRDYYAVYDLDTLTTLAQTETRDPDWLDRPAIAGPAGLVLTVDHRQSGINQLIVFDLQGQELGVGEEARNVGRQPVIDPQGEWLYLIRPRELAVLRVSDLSLQSLVPFTRTHPAGITLSPGAETLYLFGNGWSTTLATSDLQKVGVPPVSPLPSSWTQEVNPSGEILPLYLYPSPTFEQDKTAFLQLSQPYENYRSTDGGRSWLRLPAPGGPAGPFGTFTPLSLSPDFNRDHTLTAPGFRSTGGGETWTAWSPLLAFTSDRAGNREIYTMLETEDELQRQTNHPAADENPAWSPAWTYLAFQSDRSGNWDIFTMPADCRAQCTPQQLTDNPADEMLPAWSPDGHQIAFVSTRDGNPEIYVMDRNGSNQRRLTFDEAGDWRPAWLPDSRHLVFTTGRNGTNDIYQLTVPPTGSPPLAAEPELMPLIIDPSDDRDPAVGRDGTILFLSDREGSLKTYTYTINAYDGQPQIRVYSDKLGGEAHPSAWGTDNLLISIEKEGDTQLYRLWPYGEPTPITTTPGFNGQPAGGPVWWQPDPEASRQWLGTHP